MILKTPGLALLAVIHFLLQAQFWFPIWLTFLQDRRFSMAEIVFADAWFRGLIVLLEFPLGVLGDRLGRKFTFLAGAVFSVATYAVMLFISNLPLLILCWSFWAVALALQSGTDAAYRFDLLVTSGQEERATDVFGAFNAIASVSMILSYLLAGWLYTLDTRLPIFLNALFAMIAVLVLLKLKEPEVQTDVVETEQSIKSIINETWSACRTNTLVMSSIIILSLLGMYQWTTTLLFQPLLAQVGVGIAYYGIVYALFSVLGVAGGLLAGRFSRRLGERTVVWLGTVMLVGSVGWIGLVPGQLCILGLAIMRFSEQLAEPVLKVILNREISTRARASLLSFASLVGSFLLMASRPAIGMISENDSPQGAFVIWGIAGVVLLVLLIKPISRLPQQYKNPIKHSNIDET